MLKQSDRKLMPLTQSLQGSMNQHLRPDPVPFVDIAAQRRRLGKSIDEAVARVLGHCQFINGPEVTQLEAELAEFSGAKYVVSCASGTDALLMVLMAKGVGPARAAHHVFGTAEFGEFGLELGHFRAVDELAVVEHAGNRLIDGSAEPAALRGEVDEGQGFWTKVLVHGALQ